MGAFLPRKGGKHPKLFNLVLLPPSLGGIGLYLSKEEFIRAANDSPYILRKLLWFRENKDTFFDADYVLNTCFTLMRKWLTYGSFRAYISTNLEGDTIRNLELEQAIKDTLEVKTFKQLFSSLSPMEKSDMFINDSIRLRGFVPVRDLVLLLQKGYLFQAILSESVEEASFKTVPLEKRFKEIWDLIDKSGKPLFDQFDFQAAKELSSAELFKFLGTMDDLATYVNIDQVLTIDYYSKSDERQITIETKVLDQVTTGLPLLSIKLSEVAFYMS
jgi:hypothetical protein